MENIIKMPKQKVKLTEKEAYEITETIRENIDIVVNVADGGNYTEEFEKKWKGTAIPKLLSDFYSNLDYDSDEAFFSCCVSDLLYKMERELVEEGIEMLPGGEQE